MKIHFKIKIFLSLVLFAICGRYHVLAQNTPVTTGIITAAPMAAPAAFINPVTNFVRTWEPVMPTTDTGIVASKSRTIAEVKQETVYLDGLGRPWQNVAKGISSIGNDLIVTYLYDSVGRVSIKYLPYVQQSGNLKDGEFKIDPFGNLKQFYQNNSLNPGFAGESIFYAQDEYEQSPLSRVLNSYKPGSSWAREGGSHPVSHQYLYNSANDSVIIWYDTTGAPLFKGYYSEGSLAKNVTIDDNGHRTIDFVDKEGFVVLRKQQINDTSNTAYDGWLCTYSVYDKLGRLKTVIPPLAVRQMTAPWNVSNLFDELCFSYTYDKYDRVIEKRIPGSGAVYNVYDVRDRLAFTQDAVQRKKSPQEWLATFYDGLNRPTMSAIYKSNSTRQSLQANLDTTTTTSSVAYTFSIDSDLKVYDYDGRNSYTATKSITFVNEFESNTGAEFIAAIDSLAIGSRTIINASYAIAGVDSSNLTPLTFHFYDDYNFSGNVSFVKTETNYLNNIAGSYAEDVTPTNMTKGLLTGGKSRVLGTDKWMTTTNYYDDQGRLIQLITNNNQGGRDIVTNQYDFSGKLLSSYCHHRNPQSSSTLEISVLSYMEYDMAGRMISITKRINNDATKDREIVFNNYDELGRIQRKRLNVTGASSQLDSLTYTYNIQGWLTGINKNFVNSSGNTNWFGQEISYDNGFKDVQYNGNISGIKWKTKSNGIPRAYGLEYDQTSRLIQADFNQQNNAEGSWTSDKVDFSLKKVRYDANGNIDTLIQQGLIGNSPRNIDFLIYKYKDGSNKLLSVTDSIKTAIAKIGDFVDGTNTEDDYQYDENGSLIVDKNKGITAITYNYLALPEQINILGKGTIKFQYDANGTQLSKTVIDSTVSPVKISKYDYLGAFLYLQDTLQYVTHEEGRIRPVYDSGKAVTYNYDYFERDHLGNVRVILGTETDTSIYSATMESVNSAKENTLFNNIDLTRDSVPSGYPSDVTTSPNTFVAKLNGLNGQKIGPSIVLRVMAGDTIQMGVKAFYKSSAANTSQVTTNSMLTALVQAFSTSSLSDGVHSIAGANSPLVSSFNSSEYEQLKLKNPTENLDDKPKAYLNYVLFDDMFNMVENNSGVKQVQGAPDELQTLAVDKTTIFKTGFLYIYTSNESGENVYFDNLIISHNAGPLLEETHYYPFGMTMAGISSSALKGAKYPENKLRYNGKELNNKEFKDGSGLELYSYGARMYDPQIGKWHVVDPAIEEGHFNTSPYAYVYNNPILLMDPDGRDSAQRKSAIDKAWEYVTSKKAGNWYELGKKEAPGGLIDCSGLVSKSVMAGGEKDPALILKGEVEQNSGVLDIQYHLEGSKLEDKDVVPGNIVTFYFSEGYPYHTGLIIGVTKDNDGKIISFEMIHSSSGIGPNQKTVVVGKDKLGKGIYGYYKWDTKPDPKVKSSEVTINLSDPFGRIKALDKGENRAKFDMYLKMADKAKSQGYNNIYNMWRSDAQQVYEKSIYKH